MNDVPARPNPPPHPADIGASGSGPRRRRAHRIPVPLRHHWRPVALLAAFLVLVMGFFGSSRVVPFVTGDDLHQEPVVTEDVTGTVDLFDTTVEHDVQLTFRQEDYERLLQAWYDDGEKEYLEADAVIDGIRLDSVGVRLKGNSTLMSLRDPDAGSAAGGMAGGGRLPEGFQPPEGVAPPEGFEPPEGFGPPGADGGAGGGIGVTSLSAEEPEDLPWLVSFDEFVEGRQYQGRTEIAIRPSSSSSTVALNEAVALALVARTGQAGQAGAYAAVTVNGRPAATRLIVEHPDEPYAEREFGTPGVLYKSRAGSSFTDQGDDPTEYGDDFNQINRIGSQDLQPVINLIQWVQSASDEEFAAELDQHVDVDSFARYLATQNLILNSDDMDGPGKNYYLWYDLDTRTFQVVSWDLNLTFGGDATTGPRDDVGFGALFGGRGAGGAGAAPPDGAAPPAGFEPPGGDGAGAGGGPGMQGHLLEERFMATPRFTEAYDQAYRDLYQQMYGSGAALAALDDATAAALAVAQGDSHATITAESEALRTVLTERAAALAADPMLATAR